MAVPRTFSAAAWSLGSRVLQSAILAEKQHALTSLRLLLAQGAAPIDSSGASFIDATTLKAELDVLQPAYPNNVALFDPRQDQRPSIAGTNKPSASAITLHGLAHIEMNAIMMWLETALRFSPAPPGFARDCVELAHDESTHFGWLRDRMLQGYGLDYGDLPAHTGLWADATRSRDCVLHRLTILALVQEARALDVHSRLVARLRSSNDPLSAAVADQICREEVGHVQVGLKWFKHFGRQALAKENQWLATREKEETASVPQGQEVPACGLEACRALGRCCGLEESSSTVASGETREHSHIEHEGADVDDVDSKDLRGIYRSIVTRHYGSLPGPFNEAARQTAGLDKEWYAALEKPPKKKAAKLQ